WEDSQSQHLQRYQASEDDYASNSASGSVCLLCFFSTLNLPPSTGPTLSLPSPTLFFVSPLVQGLSSFHDDLIARQGFRSPLVRSVGLESPSDYMGYRQVHYGTLSHDDSWLAATMTVCIKQKYTANSQDESAEEQWSLSCTSREKFLSSMTTFLSISSRASRAASLSRCRCSLMYSLAFIISAARNFLISSSMVPANRAFSIATRAALRGDRLISSDVVALTGEA
ncbi:hypothetical protein Prudu_001461, partial [Prunus dulcis]